MQVFKSFGLKDTEIDILVEVPIEPFGNKTANVVLTGSLGSDESKMIHEIEKEKLKYIKKDIDYIKKDIMRKKNWRKFEK